MTVHTKKPWLVDFFLLAAIWGSSFLFMRIAVPALGPAQLIAFAYIFSRILP